MKMSKLVLSLLIFFAAASFPTAGHAAVFSDVLVFPLNTTATDTTSGTHVDFSYRHTFPALLAGPWTLTGATLSLVHKGNQDAGPVTEIWMASSGNSHPIGRRGESDAQQRTDIWDLDPLVLNEITSLTPWSLEVLLSEQTSFNSEKVTLYQSVLELRVVPVPAGNSSRVPEAPEPETLLLLAAALGLYRAGRRLINGGGRKCVTKTGKG